MHINHCFQTRHPRSQLQLSGRTWCTLADTRVIVLYVVLVATLVARTTHGN